jgi:hypothetical protein
VLGGLLLLGVGANLSGCADKPQTVPAPGESVQNVEADRNHHGPYPTFQFLAEAHRFVLLGVDRQGALDETAYAHADGAMLIFKDDRYIGELDTRMALAYPECLAERGGLLLLAVRLGALTSDRGNRVPTLPPADQMCPWKLDHIPSAAEASALVDAHEWPDATPAEPEPAMPGTQPKHLSAAETAAVAGFAVLDLPQLLFYGAIAAPMAGLGAIASGAHDRASRAAQTKLELDMESGRVEALLGRPAATFALNPDATEVQRYALYRANANPLWIGASEGRVVWIFFGDSRYLAAVEEMARLDSK